MLRRDAEREAGRWLRYLEFMKKYICLWFTTACFGGREYIAPDSTSDQVRYCCHIRKGVAKLGSRSDRGISEFR